MLNSKTLLAATFAGLLMTGAAFAQSNNGGNGANGGNGTGADIMKSTGSGTVGSGAGMTPMNPSAGNNVPSTSPDGKTNCNTSTSQQNTMAKSATGEGCNN